MMKLYNGLVLLVYAICGVIMFTMPLETRINGLPGHMVLFLGWAGFLILTTLVNRLFLASAPVMLEHFARADLPADANGDAVLAVTKRWVLTVQPSAEAIDGYVSQLLFALKPNHDAGPPPPDLGRRWLIFSPRYCRNYASQARPDNIFTFSWSVSSQGFPKQPEKLKALMAQHREALTPLAEKLYADSFDFADLLPKDNIVTHLETQVVMVQMAMVYIGSDKVAAYLNRHPDQHSGLRGLLLHCATGLPLSPTERLVLLFHSFAMVRNFARPYLDPAGFQPHHDLATVLAAPPSNTRREALGKLLEELRASDDRPSVPHLIALLEHEELPANVLLQALERRNDERVFEFFLNYLSRADKGQEKYILQFFGAHGKREHLARLHEIEPRLKSASRHFEIAISLIRNREPALHPPGMVSRAQSGAGSLSQAEPNGGLSPVDDHADTRL